VPIAYANYVGSFLWPQGLAVLYPHPLDSFDVSEAILKAAILVVVTVAVLILWRRMPYLPVGWLWYLGMLVPVIGVLQVGGQSMADRYTYLPQIGLAIAVVWTLSAATERLGIRAIPALASAALLAALAAAAWLQTTYWRDSQSMWVRELSFPQYNNLVSHYNYGLVLAQKGNHRAAVGQYEAGLARDSTDEASRLNLGLSYEALGSADAAILQYRIILESNSSSASGHTNLARLLQARGDDREAVEHLRAAQNEEPSNCSILSQLAILLAASPDDSLRDGGEALRPARRAVELSEGKDATSLDARAAASAETGDFVAAVADAERALKRAEADGDKKLAGDIRDRLDLYRSGKPFRLRHCSKDQVQYQRQSQTESHRIEESNRKSPDRSTADNSKRRS
jgi:tetratricopeptide (TPR) repeat protein